MKLGIIAQGIAGIVLALSLCACAGNAPESEEELTATIEMEVRQACGGIAGLQCANGYACVDDPRDNCDPATGRDCIGVCKKDSCNSDTREYVSTDKSTCTVIRFACPVGMVAFQDHCGCGCE